MEGGPEQEDGLFSEGQLFQIFLKSLCSSHSGPDSRPLSLCGDIMTFIQDRSHEMYQFLVQRSGSQPQLDIRITGGA